MKTNAAVLHLKSKDPQTTNTLCGHVTTTMAEQKAIFANPDPSLESINTENAKLGVLIATNDGTKVKHEAILVQQNVVLGLLKQLLFYVNKIAQGDKLIILSSGFDCNNDPVPLSSVPGRPVIRRVDDGSEPCSMKVYIEAVTDADRYKIEIAETLLDPKWEMYLDFATLNKLEIKGLVRAKEIFVRITAGNSLGWGEPSAPSSFIPR